MVFKRGNTYWYKFQWSQRLADGTSAPFLVRRSAKTQNQRRAREMEEEHRRAIRLGNVHPSDPWPLPPTPQAPTLKEFVPRFLHHASTRVKASSLRGYEIATRQLSSCPRLAAAPLNKLRGEVIASFIAGRAEAGLSIATINGELRVLRRMLRLAMEWEVISRAPVVHELPGSKTRDRVISFKEEALYLAKAGTNLAGAAILAVDTGLRPNSELFCLQWQNVDLSSSAFAPFGCVRVVGGKTENAVRIVPLTPRARAVLLERRAEQRHSRWVFPGSGNSGHIVSIQQSHLKALRRSGLKPFPFYSWRHTFGTRGAESGMDRFTLAKLMGHSSPRVTERYYVHVTEPHVALNFERFVSYQTAHLTKDGGRPLGAHMEVR